MNPETFYPSMKPTGASAAAPSPSASTAGALNPPMGQDEMAKAMYPSMSGQPASTTPATAPGALQTPPAAAEGGPEAYNLQVPEGFTLAQEDLAAFTPLARELGLDQAGAQRLITLHAEREAANHQATVKGWESATLADPEAGHASAISAARQVVRDYGTPALTEALERSGMGSHPEVVRLLSRIGRALRR